MILILNEWIFHDLLGENGDDRQREAAVFLNAFRSSGDRLVIPSKKRWNDKANRLMRQSDARLRIISKLFHSLLRNPAKATQQRTTPDIPDELLNRLPKEDIYLVEAYLSAGADKLITTDQPLFDSLADSEIVSCRMRDEFLPSYGIA